MKNLLKKYYKKQLKKYYKNTEKKNRKIKKEIIKILKLFLKIN